MRPPAPSIQILSFADIQAAIELNRAISATYAQIDAACRRTEAVVERGKPGHVRIENDSLELC